METNTTYVGMDVHVAKIQLAVLVLGTKHRTELELENERRVLKRLARKLKQMAPDQAAGLLRGGAGGLFGAASA